MPIELRINHLDRMVTGIAHGDVTREQIEHLADAFAEASLLHHKKLVDVSAASFRIRSEELAAPDHGLDRPRVLHRGPLAIVVDPKQVAAARIFAQLIDGGRGTRIFNSIHEARDWLHEERDDRNRITPDRQSRIFIYDDAYPGRGLMISTRLALTLSLLALLLLTADAAGFIPSLP